MKQRNDFSPFLNRIINHLEAQITVCTTRFNTTNSAFCPQCICPFSIILETIITSLNSSNRLENVRDMHFIEITKWVFKEKVHV
jgi:hypothetical protein